MKFGAMRYPIDYAMRPDRFAQACEARGFESVWMPKHAQFPTSRRAPFPGSGDSPQDYWHIHDPFVALTAAAIATRTIKVATGVCLITERDPIVTAKAVASLDLSSNGRFLFGIAAGWNAEETENHGTAFVDRWRVLEARIEAMKARWTEDDSQHHGRHVDIDPIGRWPKPLHKPHPPIVMGAASAWGRERVARYCNGWVPLPAQMKNIKADLADPEQRLLRHARARDAIEISFFWAPERLDKLKEYRDLGGQRAILGCPADSDHAALRLLDRRAALMTAINS